MENHGIVESSADTTAESGEHDKVNSVEREGSGDREVRVECGKACKTKEDFLTIWPIEAI